MHFAGYRHKRKTASKVSHARRLKSITSVVNSNKCCCKILTIFIVGAIVCQHSK